MVAWQEAHKLTLLIYKTTAAFPLTEQYAMTNQLRRAAYSIETQLAEGSRMYTAAHQLSYYHRSYGSCAEVDNFLQLSFELQYFSETQYETLLAQLNKASCLIQRLIEARAKHAKPSKLPKPAQV